MIRRYKSKTDTCLAPYVNLFEFLFISSSSKYFLILILMSNKMRPVTMLRLHPGDWMWPLQTVALTLQIFFFFSKNICNILLYIARQRVSGLPLLLLPLPLSTLSHVTHWTHFWCFKLISNLSLTWISRLGSFYSFFSYFLYAFFD